MASIKLLVQGYAQTGDVERASSTSVLVVDKDVKVVVDPGVNREALAAGLQKEGLKPEDIQYVLITHYHPDHAYGAAWFPQAALLDYKERYQGDSIKQHDGFVPGTELAIMHTPGHTPEHCSLAVPTEQGMVVVAGDVFWWPDGVKQTLDIDYPDEYAQDVATLQESRQKLLKLADVIIPGHGHAMQVTKD
ncbi:MAG: MBL fold metallo-hydrolase [Patescibacteria group bacterium]|jgi:glyoxylase-like metal-dependent hydrolase (beta-lactamase superfamily II)